MRRVAITGLGAITAIGETARQTFDAALQGRSGARRAPELAVGPYIPVVAPTSFDVASVQPRRRFAPLDRTTALALAVAQQAVQDSGANFEDRSDRTGVYWGTGMGAANSIETSYRGLFEQDAWRVKPTTVVTSMANSSAAHVSLEYGITGPTLTYTIACASSAVAIGEAMRALRNGYVDRAIAGGSEAMLTYGTMCAWMALRALAREDPDDSSRSCKPFAADRSGFVLGEGAAAIVLEDADVAMRRGAHIYGYLAGYGMSSDASHVVDPSAEGQARAMSAALEDGGLSPGDVGYINAHGTGTIAGDQVETASITRVFGNRAPLVPVSSTKAVHGHMMGATGAAEFVISVMALETGSLPPTAHLRNSDPQLGLDFIADHGRTAPGLHCVMSNSFAFGGTNAVLVAQKA
jgi:3-oxoacyl-[acyl-carrier-protein] synthase II